MISGWSDEQQTPVSSLKLRLLLQMRRHSIVQTLVRVSSPSLYNVIMCLHVFIYLGSSAIARRPLVPYSLCYNALAASVLACGG